MGKRKKKSYRPSISKNLTAEAHVKEKPTWIRFPAFSLLFPWMTLTAIFIQAVIFFWDFSANPDFQNAQIAPKTGLITFQYFIFAWLSLCFLYFSWRCLQDENSTNRFDQLWLMATFVGIVTLYIATFNPELSPNGDNAEYLIITKSIAEHGTALRLESPSENVNTLASLGLPLMLLPVYFLWGYDFIKMKILIILLGLVTFFLLFRLFRFRLNYPLAALLALTGISSPFVVGNSTDIMTETPYLFWSTLAMIAIYKYEETEKFNLKYYVAVFAFIVMAYLTRAIGIGAFVALMLFLVWNVSWTGFFVRAERKEILRSMEFKKLFYIMIPLLIGAMVWQIWQHLAGISQTAIFFSANLLENLELNCRSAFRVIGQMMFNAEVFRYQNFYRGAILDSMNIFYLSLVLLLGLGIFQGLRQKKLTAGYTLIVFIIIVFASITPSEMVIMRYLSVIMPFLIYFMFLGAHELIRLLLIRYPDTLRTVWSKMLGLMLLAQILFTNFHGNSVLMHLSALGNGPAYQDYVEVAKWSFKNLPEDAFVMSVKPRIFYLFSERKGTRLSIIDEKYSEAYEVMKLEEMRRLKITHVVLDGMSASTRENIIPIIKNHPDLFQTIYVAENAGSCSVLKFNNKQE